MAGSPVCALGCAVIQQGRWCVLPGSVESLMVLTRKLIKGITPNPQAPPSSVQGDFIPSCLWIHISWSVLRPHLSSLHLSFLPRAPALPTRSSSNGRSRQSSELLTTSTLRPQSAALAPCLTARLCYHSASPPAIPPRSEQSLFRLGFIDL